MTYLYDDTTSQLQHSIDAYMKDKQIQQNCVNREAINEHDEVIIVA